MIQNKIWDKIRKKEVANTKEEQVRQWFIDILLNHCKVPITVINSEVGIKLSKKQLRVDIIVFDRNAKPLIIVECKNPDIELNSEVLSQALVYNLKLRSKFIVITNGLKTIVYKFMGEKYEPITVLPTYEEMIKDEG